MVVTTLYNSILPFCVPFGSPKGTQKGSMPLKQESGRKVAANESCQLKSKQRKAVLHKLYKTFTHLCWEMPVNPVIIHNGIEK